MGDPRRPRSRMERDATLGGMLKHGVTATQICKACQRSFPIDLAAWCAVLGPATSLWDFYRPCPAPDCPDGLTAVHCSPGAGTPLSPLQSYDVFRTLDGMGWDFLPRWPGQLPYAYGMDLRPRSTPHRPGTVSGSRP